MRYLDSMATKKTATKKTTTKKTTTKTTTKTATKKTAPPPTSSEPDLAAQFEQRFAAIGGWRGAMLSRLRGLIMSAAAGIVEERKWVKPSNPHGVPTYSHSGLLMTLEVYQAYVKMTFAQGSKINDPAGIFNASLLGLRRAIDLRQGAVVEAVALQDLVRAAVALNVAKQQG